MNKITFVKFLSFLITASGLAVMAGWLFDIPVLKSLSGNWVSMKFLTAFSFVLSGVMLYYIAKAREGAVDAAQVVISINSFVIVLLMGLVFFSTIFNIRTGIEDLFVKDTESAASVAPGRPSVPTMIGFILMATAGILCLVNAENIRFKFRTIGIFVAFIGTLALFGYAINAPLLYYFIEGKNSAIAFHTAGLFVLWGTGLLCL